MECVRKISSKTKVSPFLLHKGHLAAIKAASLPHSATKNLTARIHFYWPVDRNLSCRLDSFFNLPPFCGVHPLICVSLGVFVMLTSVDTTITKSECFESSTLLTLLPCRLFQQQCGHPQRPATKPRWGKSAGTTVRLDYRGSAKFGHLSARSVRILPLQSFSRRTLRRRIT